MDFWLWSKVRASVFDPNIASKIKVSKEMLLPVVNKDPGWREWLIKFEIFDNQSSEDAMYIRY